MPIMLDMRCFLVHCMVNLFLGLIVYSGVLIFLGIQACWFQVRMNGRKCTSAMRNYRRCPAMFNATRTWNMCCDENMPWIIDGREWETVLSCSTLGRMLCQDMTLSSGFFAHEALDPHTSGITLVCFVVRLRMYPLAMDSRPPRPSEPSARKAPSPSLSSLRPIRYRRSPR